MKILVDGMPRTKGGIGSLILNIAECAETHFPNDGLTFEFIIAGKSGYLPLLDQKGYRYHIAPPVHDVRRYCAFLRQLFGNNDYDFLWFNNTSKVNLILPAYAKRKGTKVISHPHGVDIEEKGLKRAVFLMLNRLNRKRMFSLIDYPFACSEEAADVYYRGSVSLRQQVVVIRNGIDTDRFSFDQTTRGRVRAELAVQEDEILLGAVGRLTAVKNYPFIIRLMKHMDQRYKLIILGNGEDRAFLNELIREEGLAARCSLLGARENVQDYLFAMDLFLMPSFHEGLPYSIIEAQCTGLPCVVSDMLSREMRITDLVRYVPINDSLRWSTAILDLSDRSSTGVRSRYREQVIDAGYGIEHSFSLFRRAIGVEKT